MPVPKNIAAHTPPTNPYPPYVSINETGPGFVTVTVRNKPGEDGACGATAEIEMDEDEFAKVGAGIVDWITAWKAKQRR